MLERPREIFSVRHYFQRIWLTIDGTRDNRTDSIAAKSKKQRRLAAKAVRKQQLLNPDALAPKIPLHEQTTDLPAGDGTLEGAIDAAGARDSLTKSLRKNRRSKIKEANFLKAMA